MVRSATWTPCRWYKIDAICAAERPGSSSRSAAASVNSSGIARTLPVSDRGDGRSASTPPARQARSHLSMLPREYRRRVPSGCACSRAAIARTTAPRCRVDSAGSAASRISMYRNSPIARARSSRACSSSSALLMPTRAPPPVKAVDDRHTIPRRPGGG